MRSRLLPLLVLLGAAASGAGCRRFSAAEADREVACTLARYRARVPEVAGSLDLAAAERVAAAARAGAPLRLTLGDALALACRSSREYRRAREEAFLAALDLTGVQQDFRLRPAAGADANLVLEGGASEAGVDPFVSLSRAFETGGSLVVALASDFLRGLTTENPARMAQTILRADLFFPIGRGANRLVVREPLTQAERDTLYALRSYARFQQEFSVRIATGFWEVLEALDRLENERLSHRSLENLTERQVALGAQQAGRIPDFEVDQARQDLLRAEERVLLATTSYEAALDRFAVDLGVPPDLPLVLVPSPLEEAVPWPPPVGPEEGARTALERRLDLLNSRDRAEDARRHVLVAKDALGAEADLAVAAILATPDASPWDLRGASPRLEAGAGVDLPLERTDERNALRRAMVEEQRAARDLEETQDRVVLGVRASWRRLRTAELSRRIQEDGVALALRRVESTDLLLEAGRADTRDRLDAENSLVSARNALTRAKVEFAVARLELERDLGTLLVDERGAWRPWFAVTGTGSAVSPAAPPPPPPPPGDGPR